ncbi:tryptophan--tRNA ligase [Candidatus Parcubacteria bacterium]|uniref:Tryptophan--tRNA ligase n=1 Tax=Candidatus Kaiserbacteria bacterium CG10_big_fil_rev_8_21_14_0_10_47_16 TaxID=1974608 RepID=A0A2H0UEA2_9BACT|nr:tryptophan--tRNA ligase [Candidatus Parcubacteria bacterium]PIR84754.1 MAG: tryptophan--tRNA ligase [Candidatus Kaiserbacteria bacterium CG10_big_fil_rev_8_21_14_0_10_47_16]
MSKKRLLTGLQASGTLHIGNYFGALKPFVEMYEEYDSHLMVADYHAVTSVRDPKVLRQNTIDVVKDYIAVGVDPEKVIMFKQSDILEHTELGWILDCLVTVPFLQQAHAYKDKVAKGLEANAGLFTYPMLMAADILLYDTEVVPVGEDQRQHIEYAREAVTKFNNAYGETFIEPKEHILKGTGVVPGIDGQKMSKSYKNTIPLFGTPEEIQKAVMSIVTGTGGEIPEVLHNIHEIVRGAVTNNFTETNSPQKFYDLYTENKSNYKALKEALIEDIEKLIAPMREKRASISDDDVRAVLKAGAEKARERAAKKMEDVRTKVGVTI